MAVGKFIFPEMPIINGVRIGVTEAGIKKANRKDIVLFELAETATVAGVFTQNAFCAAPVLVCREHLEQNSVRYLLINTGNANAGTGQKGLLNARQTCESLSSLVQVSAHQVLPFSTGVIGEPLPTDKIIRALPSAITSLNTASWHDAAVGIMTTDTRPKGCFRQCEFDGQTFSIAGISKGAGMIRPNMATMLGFVATDLAIDTSVLSEMLRTAVNKSFNRITVDSDTSTNDSCVLMASGCSSLPKIAHLDSDLAQYFIRQLTEVLQELAHLIVRDGEGATKFVTVEVKGGDSVEEVTQVAFEIAHSPLIKTALYASDPNWGRILAVVGRSGVHNLDVDLVQMHINGVEIVRDGCRYEGYTEEQGQAAMTPESIHIVVDLGRGDSSDTVWTTDLSHEYVTINAEYRS